MSKNLKKQTKPSSRRIQTNYATIFVILVTLTFGLYLRYSAANHDYINQWDEAYHALVAKNFVSHPLLPTLHDVPLKEYDYKSWNTNHIWLHKPPLALWIMGFAIAVGGEQEIVFRLPSVLLGTVSIFLTFLIGKELLGKTSGILGAILHAINPLLIRLVSGTVPTDHIDLLFVFFVQMTFFMLVLAAKNGGVALPVIAGVMLGCSLLTKSLPALVVIAALPLFWVRKKNLKGFATTLAVILLTATAVVLPWSIYAALSWPLEAAWERQYTIRHLWEAMEGHSGSAYFHIRLIPCHYGGMVEHGWAKVVTLTVVLVAVVYSMFSCLRRRDINLLSVLLWALIPYAIFSLTMTKLYSFVSIGVPAVLLLIGYAIVSVSSFWKKTLSRNGNVFFRIAALGTVGLILAHVIPLLRDRIAADYTAIFWNELYDYPTFRKKLLEIGNLNGKKVILNVGDRKEIQAMYYADSPAYPDVGSPDQVMELIEKGYRPYIVVDDHRRNIEQIQEAIQEMKRTGYTNQITVVRIPRPQPFVGAHPYSR